MPRSQHWIIYAMTVNEIQCAYLWLSAIEEKDGPLILKYVQYCGCGCAKIKLSIYLCGYALRFPKRYSRIIVSLFSKIHDDKAGNMMINYTVHSLEKWKIVSDQEGHI